MVANHKPRQANYELLRIIAMLMIITLHYLDKGGILPKLKGELTTSGYMAWGLEALCIVSVNVYVLISGYFGVESTSFYPKKIGKIWGQVFFYSVTIAIISIVLGIVPLSALNIYVIAGYIFPIITEHYWFATSYVLLFLFMPFLNAGIKQINKKQFQFVLLMLIGLLSISKTIIPMTLPIDNMYHVVWFICLYFMGAYLNIYGLRMLQNKIICLVIYLGSSTGILITALLIRKIYRTTGKLEGLLGYSYHYNHILCLLGAIGLFGLFGHLVLKEGKVVEIIVKVASCTFGVYLIHEHSSIRNLWPTWFQTEKYADTPFFLLHWIVTVCSVFIICTFIEYVRSVIYDRLTNKMD